MKRCARRFCGTWMWHVVRDR